jgi:hypothetical protein
LRCATACRGAEYFDEHEASNTTEFGS